MKSKGLWHFTKNSIAYLMDVDAKFSIDVKKDEVVGIITTYILREICFHTSGIDNPHIILTKLKIFFNKKNGELMRIEKELISVEPLSFDQIKDYMDYFKEIQLKLGECGKDFMSKDG